MTGMGKLESRRQQVLKELAELGGMRRGSITEQFVESIGRDGVKKRRGPYYVHTYKEKGKTVSRRLTDPQQVTLRQKQIDAFRRFQELTAELLRIGEQAADAALSLSLIHISSQYIDGLSADLP